MLTLNAADEPDRRYWLTNSILATGGATPPQLPWLRVDRIPTIPITRTVVAGGNANITYIFPFSPPSA